MYYLSEMNYNQLNEIVMKTKVSTLVILLFASVLFCSCGKTKSGHKDGKPAIAVGTEQLNDNSAFTMSNGERCTIVAEATIDYPVSAGEGVRVDSLQRLFAAYVLESGDTLSLQEAMRQVVSNSMHQYDFMDEPVSENEVDEADDDADDDGDEHCENEQSDEQGTVVVRPFADGPELPGQHELLC